jgi:chromosome segregation ATPase
MSVPANPSVPNLPSHVQAAKAAANTWNNTIKPQVMANLHDVAGYTSLFNTLYSQLSVAATDLQMIPIDAAALAQFKASIAQLQASSKTIYNESVAIQSILSTFQSDTNTTVRNFKTDMQSVQNALSVDQSTMQELQRQMESLSQQIRAAEEEHERNTSWWMTLSTFGISQLVDLIEDLQGQISSLQNRMEQIQADESKDAQEVNMLCQVANTLGTLVGLTTVLQSASIAFVSNWQSVSNNLNELESMEQIDPSNTWAESDLAAINAEWQVIAQEVRKI